LRKELEEKFIISETNFKSINEDLKLKIQLEEASSPNDLLGFLTSRAQVNHFVEVIPSVNDIFIKTVTANA
jgi:ABC-2 type transport system ATP-binding protein